MFLPFVLSEAYNTAYRDAYLTFQERVNYDPVGVT